MDCTGRAHWQGSSATAAITWCCMRWRKNIVARVCRNTGGARCAANCWQMDTRKSKARFPPPISPYFNLYASLGFSFNNPQDIYHRLVCYEPFFMRQLIRYGLVGVVSNLAMYFVYLLITHLGVAAKESNDVGVYHRRIHRIYWPPKMVICTSREFHSSGHAVCAAHFSGYMLNFLVLFIFVDRLGYAHQVRSGRGDYYCRRFSIRHF